MCHHINPKSVDNYLSGVCNNLEGYFPHVRTSRNSALVSRTLAVCCGKKFLTSRISGPDKYRQVLLGFRMGVYRPMLEKYKIYR
jgi:hypothetical protein